MLKSLLDTRMHSRTLPIRPTGFLEASLRFPRKVNFSWKSRLFGVIKNIYLSTDFFKTHTQTQELHSWVCRDLTEVGKLLPYQLNSQILRYLNFSDSFTPSFDKHVESRFPLRLYYSRALTGSTSHIGKLVRCQLNSRILRNLWPKERQATQTWCAR